MVLKQLKVKLKQKTNLAFSSTLPKRLKSHVISFLLCWRFIMFVMFVFVFVHDLWRRGQNARSGARRTTSVCSTCTQSDPSQIPSMTTCPETHPCSPPRNSWRHLFALKKWVGSSIQGENVGAEEERNDETVEGGGGGGFMCLCKMLW